MKREEVEKDLEIFFPRCRKKHENNDCPLVTIEICGICVDKHDIDKCQFLPPLKEFLRGEGLEELMDPL